MHKKRSEICICCRVSEAKFYLYHSTKIANARPCFDDRPEHISVQINSSSPWYTLHFPKKEKKLENQRCLMLIKRWKSLGSQTNVCRSNIGVHSYFLDLHCLLWQWCRNRGARGATGRSIFVRSLNPIPTGEGRLSPPITTGTPNVFYLPASLF